MTQAAKSQEPSMEEILASIRRIIADEDATKSTQRAAEPRRAAAARPAASSSPRQPAAAPRVAPPEASFPEVEPTPPEAAANSDTKGPAKIEDQASDILDLTELMPSPPTPSVPPAHAAAVFPADNSRSEARLDEAIERSAQGKVDGLRRQVTPGNGEWFDARERLMSHESSAAVDVAFNTLVQTAAAQNARTLEDLVRDMLRPFLKTWLDDNLPALVERLVRAEIERVSRGR